MSSCGPLSWPLYDETLGKPGGTTCSGRVDGVAQLAGRAVERQIAVALLPGHIKHEVFAAALLGGQRELSLRRAFERDELAAIEFQFDRQRGLRVVHHRQRQVDAVARVHFQRQFGFEVERDAGDDFRPARADAPAAVRVGGQAEGGHGVGEIEVDRRPAVGVGDQQRIPVERFGEIAPHARFAGSVEMGVLAGHEIGRQFLFFRFAVGGHVPQQGLIPRIEQ